MYLIDHGERVTDRRVNLSLSEFDESLEDPDGQIAQDLSILGQIEVAQTVLVLLWSIARLEDLQETRHSQGVSHT